MSMGPACTHPSSTDIPTPDGLHRHVVVTREANYSRFNGSHWTPSDYSEVRCLATGRRWRTKADYVNSLPDETSEETHVYPGVNS